HDSGFFASVGHDLAQRRFNGATQQLDTNVLVFVVTGQVFEGHQGAHQGYTTARYHAFFNSGASSVQRVFYAVLLLFHFHFGSGADLDDRNTASQLGQTLLQFFLVVVGRGFFNLLADLGNTRFDISLGTSTVDHGGVVLVDLHALGLTQVFQASGFQAHADFFADHGTAGEDGDVLQHGLATVTEARRLDGNNLDDTAHVVDYQGSQRFAFNVFGNDHQRTTGLGDSFQHRQHFADVGDLLVNQQEVRVVQLRGHGFRLVDEVGRQVATVELHAFNDGQLVFQTGTFLNGDHAFLAYTIHGFGNDLADGIVGVGGDGTHLGDRLGIGAGLGQVLQLGNNGSGSLVDTALQVQRVHAGSNGLQPFGDDGLGQYGSGSSTVTGVIVVTGSNVLDQLRAHVLEAVFQLDFLGDGYAVLGDHRRAEAALDQHVAALRPQGGLDRIGQNIDAFEHLVACGNVEQYFFSSHFHYPSNEFVQGIGLVWSQPSRMP